MVPPARLPSYQLSCANTTSAAILTYLTADCSGAPVATTDYPVDFGCTASGTGSSNTLCVAGDFQAPSPAGNTYAYNNVYACPPTGGDLTTVITYPCGTCIDYTGGVYAAYSCDSASVDFAYYSDASCSGAAIYSYPLETTGCAATSTQVTVTECDLGKSEEGGMVQALPAELKAAQAAAQSMHDMALAKANGILATALALA